MGLNEIGNVSDIYKKRLLKLNSLLYDINFDCRHKFWVENVEYDNEKTRSGPNIDKIKNTPYWKQLCAVEDYLYKEYIKLSFVSAYLQFDPCAGCENIYRIKHKIGYYLYRIKIDKCREDCRLGRCMNIAKLRQEF
jgi:hypothetical protein